ncbi:MAG: YtxH domain-containing protein [Elusimicrobiales bacterium]|nr:YtxH domain-containing protein [Elusimicrobiales bacterium]HOL62980.1 YtxH domain-containing protein [Elusimicrobiales bacterium]HPO95439.1 YtxH domain-containing protein [Elusimicrobiales bacterium]
MSENKTGDILTAFVIGGLVGAVIGILFAPAAGKVTRERIGDWVEEKKEDAKEALEKLEEEIKKKKEQLTK